MKAKALYDNASEDTEELSFLRNDVVEVIEQDYDGMEGWWLCRLRGKSGIAPGNRLMIITVVGSDKDYDTPKGLLEDRRCREDDYATPVSKSQLNTPSDSSSDKRSSNNSEKSSDSSKSHSNLLNESSFSKLYSSFKKSQKDTEMPAKQMEQMIEKWINCQNSVKLQMVIKTMSVNLWKHLQDYLAQTSKLFASLRSLASPEVFKKKDEMKKLSRDMEDVLEQMNRQALDQSNFLNMLTQLSNIVKQLLENILFLSVFYDNVNSEKLWLKVIEEESCHNSQKLKTKKYESTCSFSSTDYDLPRQSKVNGISDCSPQRVHSTDFNAQMNKLRIENLVNSSEFTDYDRPKSIDNLNHKQSTTTDYDMPRNSTGEISVKQDHSYRPKSLDTLDYDSPTSSRLLPNNSIKNKNKGSYPEQNRANSDYIASPDYDIPPTDNTRKSMEQLLTLVNQQGFKTKFNQHSNLPQKSAKHASRVASSFETSDYDYPSASASQIDIEDNVRNNKPSQYTSNKSINTKTSISIPNIPDYDTLPTTKDAPDLKKKQRTLPNLDKSESNLLKYYKPHLQKNIESVYAHLELLNSHIDKSELTADTLTKEMRYLVTSSHKLVFIIDFITRRLSNHKVFSRELNIFCNKIVDYLKIIASYTKMYNKLMNNKIKQSLGDLKSTLCNIEEAVGSWES